MFKNENSLGWQIEFTTPKLKIYKDSEDPVYILDSENGFSSIGTHSKIIDYVTNKIEGSSYVLVDYNSKDNKEINKFISKSSITL